MVMVEWSNSKKYGAIFGGAFVLAGLVLSIKFSRFGI